MAVLTYQRPKALSRLLSEFERLRIPQDCSVYFLIVDNDPESSAKPVVEAVASRTSGLSVRYTLEPEPGIPAARNRALDEAIAVGADLLCFTDDDAWPHSDWLIHLVDCYRDSRAALTFGPVTLLRPDNLNSVWKRFIARSMEAQSRFIHRFAEKESLRGRIATSGTGNWLGDLNWILKNGIRFNPELQFSGGSDTAFRELVRKKNGPMAWCPKAIVFEEISENRLSLKYQLHRSRVQGMNSAKFKRQIHPVVLRHPFGRILVGAGLIIFPVLGMASFSLGLHQIGMGVGILQARRGKRGELYLR